MKVQENKIYRIRNKLTNDLERISNKNPLNIYKTRAHAISAITECFWYDRDMRKWAKDNLEVVEYDLVENKTYPYKGKDRYRISQSKTRREISYGKKQFSTKNRKCSGAAEQSEECVLQSSEAVHDG